jgi:hypothetical protein
MPMRAVNSAARIDQRFIGRRSGPRGRGRATP